MGEKRATRRSSSYDAPYVPNTRNYPTISDNFERGSRWAGILLALSFGMMLAIGIILGW